MKEEEYQYTWLDGYEGLFGCMFMMTFVAIFITLTFVGIGAGDSYLKDRRIELCEKAIKYNDKLDFMECVKNENK